MQLVDTNVISELMRPTPDAGVRRWLGQLADSSSRLDISAVTIDEIVFSLTRRPRALSWKLFNDFVASNRVRDVSETVARRAGEMRALLAARGQVRSQADMLIAATAQVHALTLITRNVRDFDGCGIAVLNPFER